MKSAFLAVYCSRSSGCASASAAFRAAYSSRSWDRSAVHRVSEAGAASRRSPFSTAAAFSSIAAALDHRTRPVPSEHERPVALATSRECPVASTGVPEGRRRSATTTLGSTSTATVRSRRPLIKHVRTFRKPEPRAASRNALAGIASARRMGIRLRAGDGAAPAHSASPARRFCARQPALPQAGRSSRTRLPRHPLAGRAGRRSAHLDP